VLLRRVAVVRPAVRLRARRKCIPRLPASIINESRERKPDRIRRLRRRSKGHQAMCLQHRSILLGLQVIKGRGLLLLYVTPTSWSSPFAQIELDLTTNIIQDSIEYVSNVSSSRGWVGDR